MTSSSVIIHSSGNVSLLSPRPAPGTRRRSAGRRPCSSRPPRTITTPAAQRTRGPKRLLEQLGNRDHARIAQRLDAEAGQTDHEHRHRLADARRRAGKAVLVARLGRVHAGDDAELGRRQRGDAEKDVHLAAGDEKVLDLADVLADEDARRHRGEQVEADDRTVDPGRKVRHAAAALLDERSDVDRAFGRYSSCRRSNPRRRSPIDVVPLVSCVRRVRAEFSRRAPSNVSSCELCGLCCFALNTTASGLPAPFAYLPVPIVSNRKEFQSRSVCRLPQAALDWLGPGVSDRGVQFGDEAHRETCHATLRRQTSRPSARRLHAR